MERSVIKRVKNFKKKNLNFDEDMMKIERWFGNCYLSPEQIAELSKLFDLYFTLAISSHFFKT